MPFGRVCEAERALLGSCDFSAGASSSDLTDDLCRLLRTIAKTRNQRGAIRLASIAIRDPS